MRNREGGRKRIVYYRILAVFAVIVFLGLVYLQLRPEDYFPTVTSDSSETVTLSGADVENGYRDDFKQVYLMPGTYHLTIDAKVTTDDSETASQPALYEVVDQQTNIVCASGDYEPEEEYHALSFTVERPLHCMVVRSYPGENNTLTIYGYTLAADGAVCTDAKWAVVLLAQFLFLLWIGCRRAARRGKPAFLILTILAAVVSLPFLGSSMPSGHDLSFHLARIESLGYAIRDGQIPERINTAFAGHGNITPILYPELVLIQSGFLCAQNTTVWFAYKAGMVFLTFLTAYLAYIGVRAVLPEKTALLFAFLYTLNPFRLNDIFLRAAVGEAFALAFLPLVFGGMVCLLTDGTAERGKGSPSVPEVTGKGILTDTWKREKSKTQARSDTMRQVQEMILTVAGATGLLSSHVLSTMTAAAFCLLAVICVLLTHPLRFLKDRRRIGVILLTAVLCVLCNLWFLVPFLQFQGEDFVVANQFVQLARKTPYLWQLFMDPGAMSAFSLTASTKGEMSYTIGPAMLVAAGAFAVLAVWNRRRNGNPGLLAGNSAESTAAGADSAARVSSEKQVGLEIDTELSMLYKIGAVSLLFGLIGVFMASNFFPWSWLCDHVSLFRGTFGQMQYRWRMQGFNALFFTMCGAIAVQILQDEGRREQRQPSGISAGTDGQAEESFRRKTDHCAAGRGSSLCGIGLAIVLMVLCTVSAVRAGTEYYQNDDYLDSKWEHEQYLSPDYLQKDIYEKNGQQILSDLVEGKGPSASENVTITGYYADGADYAVDFVREEAGDAEITVPVTYNGLYEAEGMATSMDPEEQFTIIHVPGNWQDGEIRLTFREKPLWKVCDVVSIAAWILVAVLMIVSARRRRAALQEDW